MASVLDTNVIINALNGNKKAMDIFRKHQTEVVYTTVVNKYEFMRGLQTSKLSDSKKIEYTDFINKFKLYDFTSTCVKLCSDIYTKLRESGSLINELDIIILGICAENNALLITSDRDFIKTGKLVGVNVEFLEC